MKRSSTSTAHDDSGLLRGILDEADAKIRDLDAQAADYAQRRMDSAATQARALEAAALADARDRAEAVLKDARAALDAERARLVLEAEAAFEHRVMDLTAGECRAVAGRPDYPAFMESWIAEAAIGLGHEEADVLVPEAERAVVTPELLRRAEARASAASGNPVRLTLAGEPAPDGTGPVLQADGGRLAYDNRVGARLGRARRAVQTLVMDALDTSGATS
ncbi:MAG: hypothetical protein JW923_09940 [Spirochaetales bacterium]|nr:hypothetical protein [Spirochaetales bacterium]